MHLRRVTDFQLSIFLHTPPNHQVSHPHLPFHHFTATREPETARDKQQTMPRLPSPHLLFSLLILLLPLLALASPPLFCKCTCGPSSQIIQLSPQDSCDKCSRQFCLSYHIKACETFVGGGKEKEAEVLSECFREYMSLLLGFWVCSGRSKLMLWIGQSGIVRRISLWCSGLWLGRLGCCFGLLCGPRC